MNNHAIKKIAVLCGFLAGILSLAINLMCGSDLFYAAFSACWVMLAASLLLLGIMRMVVSVLMDFLHQQTQGSPGAPGTEATPASAPASPVVANPRPAKR